MKGIGIKDYKRNKRNTSNEKGIQRIKVRRI